MVSYFIESGLESSFLIIAAFISKPISTKLPVLEMKFKLNL